MDDQQTKTDWRAYIADVFGIITIIIFMLIVILFLIWAGGEPTMFGTSTMFGISPSKATTYIPTLGSALMLTSLGYFACRVSA